MKSLNYLFLITVFLASLGQLASDIYLPSLPYIARSFHITPGLVQFTVAAFMLGFFLPRLAYGISSDALGRKKPLLVGLVICLVGSVICYLSSNIWVLIVGRLLQGFGAAAGVTVSGAVVRDCFEGTALAKFESYRAVVIVSLLSFTPLLGGYIQHYLGWRTNFTATIIFTVLTLALFFQLPETNKYIARTHIRPKAIKENLKTLFMSKNYLLYGICIFMAYAGILAWLTLGPILLQNSLGINSVHLGWILMVVGGAYVVCALMNAKLVKRFGFNNMLKKACWFMAVGALLELLFAISGFLNIYVVVAPLMLFVGGTGLVFANAYTGALMPFPKIAGIAGSVLGTLQIVGGFLASSLISALPDTSQLPLAMVITFCAASTIVAVCLINKESAQSER